LLKVKENEEVVLTPENNPVTLTEFPEAVQPIDEARFEQEV